MVKIGSVAAEIFLIWANVATKNVAWTNVTVTFGNCSRWSQEPTIKVWSQVGLSRATLEFPVKVFLIVLLDSKYTYTMFQ